MVTLQHAASPLAYWDLVLPGVQACLRHNRGEYESGDYFHGLQTGAYALWLIYNGAQYRGFAITERLGGRRPVLNVVATHLEPGADVLPDVTRELKNLARSLKCGSLQFHSSRPGWARRGRELGFEPVYTVWRALA